MRGIEQILGQIQRAWASDKIFSEQELGQLSGFLAGSLSHEAVRSILPARTDAFYPGQCADSEAICAACGGDPQRMHVLGRYLLLIREPHHKLYVSLVRHMAELLEMDLQDFFLATVCQATDQGTFCLLEYLLSYINIRDLHDLAPSIEAHLERIWQRDPGGFEDYLERCPSHQRLLPLAYLCAKKGWDLHSLEGSTIKEKAYLQALALEATLHTLSEVQRLEPARREPMKAALEARCPYMAPALHNEELAESCANMAFFVAGNLFTANHVSGYRLELLNAIVRAFFQADRSGVVAAIVRIYDRHRPPAQLNLSEDPACYNKPIGEAGPASIVERVREVEAVVERIGLDPAALCAWIAGRAATLPLEWGDVFRLLYAERPVLLQRTAEQAEPLAGIYLHRVLAKTGETLSVQQCEAWALELLASSLQARYEPAETEPLLEWLAGLGEGEPARLPALEWYFAYGYGNYYRNLTVSVYAFDQAMYLLADVSRMPDRYLRYLAARRHWSNLCSLLGGLGLLQKMSLEQITEFVVRNRAQAAAIAALADLERLVHVSKQDARELLAHLVSLHPDLAAGVLLESDTAVEARMALLDLLYGRGTDMDPAPLVACLGNRSKRVREQAYRLLLPRRKLIEEVRPLLDSKKKSTKEMARRLMDAWRVQGVG